jgi:hypothetical protein
MNMKFKDEEAKAYQEKYRPGREKEKAGFIEDIRKAR